MNFTPKGNPEEFTKFLDQINLDLYQYKFLKNYLYEVASKKSPIYDTSILNTSPTGWILIIHGDRLLVYGENWNNAQFSEIEKVFDLSRFTNFPVAGDAHLVTALLAHFKPTTQQIEKRRLFYRATKISSYEDKNLRIRLGKHSDIPELAGMMQQYYHEEYDGSNEKTTAEMRSRISLAIGTRNIYLLEDKNTNVTLSFCTLIDPDIGILFVKTAYRNKGYAKIALSFCSNILMKKNNIVYLMTDERNPQSNSVARAVGFEPYFEYLAVEINQTS